MVASWGGLRGAVGLALALVMKSLMKADMRDERNGARIQIMVSITVILTLLVNAPTTGLLVRKLGLTRVRRIEQQAVRNVRCRIRRNALGELAQLRSDLAKADHKLTRVIEALHSDA